MFSKLSSAQKLLHAPVTATPGQGLPVLRGAGAHGTGQWLQWPQRGSRPVPTLTAPRHGPRWGCSQGSASPPASLPLSLLHPSSLVPGQGLVQALCPSPASLLCQPGAGPTAIYIQREEEEEDPLNWAQPDTPSPPEISSQQLMSGEKGADVRSELVASSLCLFLLAPHHHRDELCLEKAGMGLGCCREAPSHWAACLFPGPEHA